jgi:GrxC family glutaredoxin
MRNIEIYTKLFCPFCTRAKGLLDSMGVEYTEYKVSFDADKEREMNVRSYRSSVPQIFVNGQSIGGSDDLEELIDAGVFTSMLQNRNIPHNNSEIRGELRNAA